MFDIKDPFWLAIVEFFAHKKFSEVRPQDKANLLDGIAVIMAMHAVRPSLVRVSTSYEAAAPAPAISSEVKS